MDNLLTLKALCSEYANLVQRLFQNKAYQIEQKKEAYALLVKGYRKKFLELNTQLAENRDLYIYKMRDSISAEDHRFQMLIANSERIEVKEEVECRILKEKLSVVAEIIREHKTIIFVKDSKIIFQKDGQASFSFPLDQEIIPSDGGNG